MTGRTDNGILINDSSGLTQIKSNVQNIRRNYTYPAWFENTLQLAFDGTISERELNNAVDNLSNQGVLKLSSSPIVRPPSSGGYNRPTFEHDSDVYGFDYLYGQRDFQSDQDIWKRFSEDLTRHEEQEGRISDAHAHRLSIEEKVNNAKAEHQKIWDSISTLHTKHTNQEDRISQKSGIGHTHAGGEEKEDCGWFGEKCWFPDFEIPTWLKLVGAAIGIGLLLWLIRPLLKIGANVTK